jgi:cbb3-type cytochrome oxidase maturation protein
MHSILLLIPFALGLGAIGLCAFLWALRNGQFDDLDGAASRILFDDLPPSSKGDTSCPASPPSSSEPSSS